MSTDLKKPFKIQSFTVTRRSLNTPSKQNNSLLSKEQKEEILKNLAVIKDSCVGVCEHTNGVETINDFRNKANKSYETIISMFSVGEINMIKVVKELAPSLDDSQAVAVAKLACAVVVPSFFEFISTISSKEYLESRTFITSVCEQISRMPNEYDNIKYDNIKYDDIKYPGNSFCDFKELISDPMRLFVTGGDFNDEDTL